MSEEQQQENQVEFSSEEFVLVDKSSGQTDNESNSHNSVGSMDEFSTGSFVQNPVEFNVVQNIKKLAGDNEALKKSLVRHNKVIETYCTELEEVKNAQIKDKKDTNAYIGKLQAENDLYKRKLGDCSCDSGQGMPVHSITLSELAQRFEPFMKSMLQKFEKFKNMESLKYPQQETQCAEFEETVRDMEKFVFSMTSDNLVLDGNFVGVGISEPGKERLLHQIEQLKADLSERMKDSENLSIMEEKFTEVQEKSSALKNENDRFRKAIKQMQVRIEQLECEPSVEIMQISSPQQTQRIESLNEELSKAKEQITLLLEEKECLEKKVGSLNEVCVKMTKDASLNAQAEGQEISEMRQSYDTAFEGLKAEIEAEQKKVAELEQLNTALGEKLKDQEAVKATGDEETINLKRTIEMLKKREYKDMDKLNQMTSERDKLSKECADKLRVIQDLNAKLENLHVGPKDNDLRANQAREEPTDPSHFAKQLEVMSRQISSDEQTIGIIAEENTNLKDAIHKREEVCNKMSNRIEELMEENRRLSRGKAQSVEMMENYNRDHYRIKQLETEIDALQNTCHKMQQEVQAAKQKQANDGTMILHLKEELMKHEQRNTSSIGEMQQCIQALQESKQKNEMLEQSLSKKNTDSAKIWRDYQKVLNQLKMMEQQMKKADEGKETLMLKHRQALDMNQEKFNGLLQHLQIKDREIQKLTDELQTMDIYKEQVKVYESDFNMEREAREKQHSDILILREDLHHLKLENIRLKEDFEASQQQKMQELKKRMASSHGYQNPPSSYPSQYGIYGRGAAVPDNNRINYGRSNESYRGSIELPPQEPDPVMQRECPKCRAPFPDLDTLQLHVLECLDD